MQTLLGISFKYWSSLWLKMENYIEIIEREGEKKKHRKQSIWTTIAMLLRELFDIKWRRKKQVEEKD